MAVSDRILQTRGLDRLSGSYQSIDTVSRHRIWGENLLRHCLMHIEGGLRIPPALHRLTRIKLSL